ADQDAVLPPARPAEGRAGGAQAAGRAGSAAGEAGDARPEERGRVVALRVLFSAETPLSLTSYQSVIRELDRRGHDVVVAIHEEREIGWRDRLLEEVAAPHVAVEAAVSPRQDRWLELGADLRSSIDLFEFLGPQFNETYRARARRRAPKPAAALARTRLARSAVARRTIAGAFELAENALPTNAEIERYLRDRRPDVVLFTPYLGLRSAQPAFL